MATKNTEMLVARISFLAPGNVHIKQGQLVNAKDKLVKGRRELFITPEEAVEAATANPGELRINNRSEDAQSGKAKARAAAEKAKEDA